MSNWKKEYDNDVGPDDDYFIEWWAVTDGKRTFKCDTSEDADFLISVLQQPESEPVAWAISFDGETPYTLWDGGDCALLDIEVNRHGGKTRKMPLYTSPPKREPPCKTGSQCITKCMECAEPKPVIDKSAAIRIATSLGWTPKREPLTDEQVNLVREMRDVQGQHGNWNYDPYMQGLYNGLEFAMSLLEKREPVFRDAPEQWLGDITIKRDKFNSIEECKPTTGIKGEV